jgi:hypothetical protein
MSRDVQLIYPIIPDGTVGFNVWQCQAVITVYPANHYEIGLNFKNKPKTVKIIPERPECLLYTSKCGKTRPFVFPV